MNQPQMQIYRNILQHVFEGKFGENLQATKTFSLAALKTKSVVMGDDASMFASLCSCCGGDSGEPLVVV